MLGLIQKDLYNLKKQLRSLAIFALFYVVLGIVSSDMGSIMSVLIIVMVMQVFTTMTFDDQTNWDRYALTMPVRKKDIVRSKYILSLALLLFSGAFTSIVLAVSSGGNYDTLQQNLLVNVIVMGVYFVFSSILLPVAYKFGVEKMRMIMMLFLVLPIVALGIFVKFGAPMPAGSLSHLRVYLPAVKIAAPFILVGIGIISYLLSVKIFEKKEIA